MERNLLSNLFSFFLLDFGLLISNRLLTGAYVPVESMQMLKLEAETTVQAEPELQRQVEPGHIEIGIGGQREGYSEMPKLGLFREADRCNEEVSDVAREFATL